jgi:hypothetical protein
MKILTQNGFSNFDGFISQGIKPVLKLELKNGSCIEATSDHKFLLKDMSWIELKDLTTHHILYNDLKIKSITNQNKSIEVYDALNVTDGHRFNANGIIISNCNMLYIDECAFIQNWTDFSASVLPVLSSGKSTKLIFTSTPKGLNHFYDYYEGAKKKTNGFKLIEVKWNDVPGRDEKWKEEILGTLNHDLERFEQEYCVSGDTEIEIKDENNNIILKKIKDVYNDYDF